MTLAFDAMKFAIEAHKAQRRKYTNNPYIDHLAEVAGIVATVTNQQREVSPGIMVAVAWLHDCVEDQGITAPQLLAIAMPEDVVTGVILLSDLEQGNRAERKAASRARLAKAPSWVQTIKCADLISNTSSIVEHDPKFAVVYLGEKRLLLDVLKNADPRLLEIARSQTEAKP